MPNIDWMTLLPKLLPILVAGIGVGAVVYVVRLWLDEKAERRIQRTVLALLVLVTAGLLFSESPRMFDFGGVYERWVPRYSRYTEKPDQGWLDFRRPPDSERSNPQVKRPPNGGPDVNRQSNGGPQINRQPNGGPEVNNPPIIIYRSLIDTEDFIKAISAVLFLATLYIILSSRYEPPEKHWAYGVIGTLLGHWFNWQ